MAERYKVLDLRLSPSERAGLEVLMEEQILPLKTRIGMVRKLLVDALDDLGYGELAHKIRCGDPPVPGRERYP